MTSRQSTMSRPGPCTLPETITGKLVHLRSEIRRVKLLEGLFAGLAGLLASFLALFLLDRLWESPPALRALMLAGGTAVSAMAIPVIWQRWIRGQRRLEDVAQVVQRSFPRLGDQLLGTIELARDTGKSGSPRSSPRLVEAAIAQAAERIRDQDLSGAIPPTHHRRWAAVAAILLGLALLTTVLSPPAARSSLLRWLLPWSDTPRYTFAQLEELPDPLIVPLAESFRIEPRLRARSRWRPSSASATIDGQPALRSALEQDSSCYPFTFPPQQSERAIKLRVGDERAIIRLQPRSRPELASLEATLRLPEYLGYSSDPRIDIHGRTERILKGSEISLRATATRPLASAAIDEEPQAIDEQGRLTTAFSRLDTSRRHRIEWVDALGLGPRDPIELRIEACEDASPTISARSRSSGQVVLDTEVVTFDLSARDDFGLRAVGLEWQTAGSQGAAARDRKLSAEGGPEVRQIDTPGTFCARDAGVAPGRISIRAWAEDFLPGRAPSRSSEVLLHIVNTTDHAFWLSGQFSKWLDATRETYEREQQLNIANRELRDLDPEQLDRSDTRRSIARQAAMEAQNAERLAQLTDKGRQLVEQGTRNPEFNADQLESWAAMIERLEELAVERMPSVSDLLEQSSRAAKGSPTRQSPSTQAAHARSAQPQAPDPQGEGTQNASGENPQPPDSPNLPALGDSEKSYLDPDMNRNAQSPPSPAAGGPGLPTTTLAPIPAAEDADDPDDALPAEQHLAQALDEQDDLLAEFRAVTDLLAELLGSFEASTFVKRLKAASRAQMEIADGINAEALSAFGLPEESPEIAPRPARAGKRLAERAETEIATIQTIQGDLSAFISRKPDPRFNRLLKTMKEQRVVRELEAVPATLRGNLSGTSIAASEFWADTLDRWAEELVAATNGPP